MAILIRPETTDDQSAIHDLTRLAFSTMAYADGDEQDVIDRLRASGGLALSLVAEQAGAVIGQVTFSPAQAPGGVKGWYTLGPVSVDPAHQKKGVGGQLIKAGLDRLRVQGAAGCILVGNPAYYSRFGFTVSTKNAPPDGHEHFFQILPMASAVPEGVFGYHSAFSG